MLLPHYDLLCITETWLNESIDSSELGLLNDYYVFRADRTTFSSVKGSGGGVILAVSKKKFNCIQLKGDNSIDQVFVKIWSKDFCMLVGLLYIPPMSPLEKYISAYELIQDLIGDFENILIIGDFNLPGYLWYSSSSYSYMSGSNLNWVVRDAAQHMNNLCRIFKLYQFNLKLNSFGNILELVLFKKKL